jgi:lipoprotein-anchoring transpeptidase ErfK/SrfK
MKTRPLLILLCAAIACAAVRHSPKRPVRAPARPPFTVEDVQNATQNDPLGQPGSGPRVMHAQILLDRARFSPGEIDAQYGEDLAIAVKGFQQNHGQAPSGTIDAATWDLLNQDTQPLFTNYTITAADVRGPFAPVPKDIHARARLKWLGYESAEEELGEKFHVAPKLLAQLNPGKTLAAAGEQIVVPNVQRPPARPAARVVVSASQRTVTALAADGSVLAQYPATMGGPHDPLPIGNWTIASVSHNPYFFYQPGRFWNADPHDAKDKLPPGPNNPVGVVWMGLSKRHFGIHGTPDPGHIRHGESYGCIRLTNWDALDLSHMVRRGMPAILEE